MSAPNLVELDRRRLLRARWVRRLVIVAVVLALGAVVWLVGFSSVLGVRAVQIDGGDAAMRQRVRTAVALQPGEPLARVNVAAMAGRITEQVPTVRTVTVDRRWPSTVTVTVTPRVAVIAMRAGSDWDLIDEQGVVVARQHSAPASLPVLTRAGVPDAVTAAAAVVSALPKKIHGTVRTVTAATADSVTLHTAKGLTVVWGSRDESEQKARVLAALLAHKARVYDVSSPELPTTRD